VEAIDRRSNHCAPASPQPKSKLFRERRLTGGVWTIDCDSNRVRTPNSIDYFGELLNKCGSR
jgi:hypothetical protein